MNKGANKEQTRGRRTSNGEALRDSGSAARDSTSMSIFLTIAQKPVDSENPNFSRDFVA
jgi:hypothetical protein